MVLIPIAADDISCAAKQDLETTYSSVKGGKLDGHP